MFRMLSLLSLLLFTSLIYGQVIEKTIAVGPVSYFQSNTTKENAEKLREFIIHGLHQTQRLKIIDRTDLGTIIDEQEIQKQKESIFAENLVKQGKILGADYIFFCKIINAQPTEIKNNKSDELLGYHCDLTLFTRVTNVETGELVASALINSKGIKDRSTNNLDELDAAKMDLNKLNFLTGKSSTKEEALLKSMNKLEPHIFGFINKYFPLQMHINDIQEIVHSTSKKEKAVTEVFIKGGKSTGLMMKDNLEIIEIAERNIGDKIYIDEVPIATMKVIRLSQDLVVCKILSQSKVVEELFRENPESLKAVYRSKSGPFSLIK